jgi:hypothetical protein
MLRDRRKRGRPSVKVLWCPNRKNAEKRAGWSFPREVEEKIVELSAGGTVLHLFGGQSRFGVRLDIDPRTRPDVLGDAWMPPFLEGSFDTVVLDPPYHELCREELGQLMANAAFVCRKQAIWLHQIWAPSQFGLSLERAWMVRVGDSSVVRCLQLFTRNSREGPPGEVFLARSGDEVQPLAGWRDPASLCASAGGRMTLHSELLNLYFFALAIVKASLITGIAPMIFIFYAAKLLGSFERGINVARKPSSSWRVWVNPNPPSAGRKVA